MQARAGLLFGMAVVALTGPTAVAQEQDTTNTIDRIVAIVGTRAILASQVTERFYTELANREPPKDPKVVRQLQQGILRSMVNEELVVQEAQRDTMIKVTDQEVTESVDEPPGTRSRSTGLRTGPNAEFSFDEPMANSSQLALPMMTPPAASRRVTAVAS